MRIIVISNEPILASFLCSKIDILTSKRLKVIKLLHEDGHEDSYFENAIILFVLNRTSELEYLPYYYKVYSIMMTNNISVSVLHNEGIRSLSFSNFPLDETKFYDLSLEFNLFLNDLSSKLHNNTSNSKKKMSFEFDNLFLETIISREIALAKRLGSNFSVTYMIIKNTWNMNLVEFKNVENSIEVNLREVDTVFITKENEVISLFPTTHYEGALVVSQKIAKEVMRHFRIVDVPEWDFFSIEIITYPQNAVNQEHFLHKLNGLRIEYSSSNIADKFFKYNEYKQQKIKNLPDNTQVNKYI